jgi:hypothetical protein
MERILYIWAMRHPASGYVQGINDLIIPFLYVFLQEYQDTHKDISISDEQLRIIEADSFWCLNHILDGIQDHYTFGQPGIHRQIQHIKEIIQHIDISLYDHLMSIGLDNLPFAFRWINCLLVREMSLENTVRMWDTYISEGISAFSEFHIYVCASYLYKWSSTLKNLDFQDIMLFFQDNSSIHWTEEDISLLLSEAFVWKSIYHNKR